MNHKLTEQLDGIKCPHCGGYDRLSISVDARSVYCAECGGAVSAEYLRAQSFILPAPDYHDPAPPQSCADLLQHLTFDGEPSYTDERD